MEKAYRVASGSGRYPVNARRIVYAARPQHRFSAVLFVEKAGFAPLLFVENDPTHSQTRHPAASSISWRALRSDLR